MPPPGVTSHVSCMYKQSSHSARSCRCIESTTCSRGAPGGDALSDLRARSSSSRSSGRHVAEVVAAPGIRWRPPGGRRDPAGSGLHRGLRRLRVLDAPAPSAPCRSRALPPRPRSRARPRPSAFPSSRRRGRRLRQCLLEPGDLELGPRVRVGAREHHVRPSACNPRRRTTPPPQPRPRPHSCRARSSRRRSRIPARPVQTGRAPIRARPRSSLPVQGRTRRRRAGARCRPCDELVARGHHRQSSPNTPALATPRAIIAISPGRSWNTCSICAVPCSPT